MSHYLRSQISPPPIGTPGEPAPPGPDLPPPLQEPPEPIQVPADPPPDPMQLGSRPIEHGTAAACPGFMVPLEDVLAYGAVSGQA